MRAVTTESLPALDLVSATRPRMSWRRCKGLIASDLFRYQGRIGVRAFWRHFLFTPVFRYSVALRLGMYARSHRWTRFGLHQFMSWTLYRYSVRYGISISSQSTVGAGLYIGHFGGIFINHGAVIGDNCNIQQGVTLGK